MLSSDSAIVFPLLKSKLGLVQKLRSLGLISAYIEDRVARQGVRLVRWATMLMWVFGASNEHEEVWYLVGLLVPCSTI